MVAIVAVDEANGIGKNGDLLCRISGDLKNFRKLTAGKTIVYGRKTMDTFPGRNPLPNRTNVVLSRNPELECEGVIVVHDVESVLLMFKDLPSDELVIIGGESVYKQFIPYLDKVYMTRIFKDFDADAHFYLGDDWYVESESEVMEENGIQYQFLEWSRN